MQFYDDVLRQFCIEDDVMRKELRRPFGRSDGYVYATDGHALMRVPVMMVKQVYKDGGRDTYHIWEKFRVSVSRYVVETETLRLARENLPMVNEYMEVKCPKCDGEGEIVCDYCDHTHECDYCDGDGWMETRQTGKKVFDEYARVQIGGIRFSCRNIGRLLAALEVNSCEEVEVVIPRHDENDYPPILFRFLGVDVILTPVMDSEMDIVVVVELGERASA